MATVNKDFRVKHGLVVEGTTGTINGEDILTTASTTDDLTQGSTNLYFSDELAQDAINTAIAAGTHDGITITYDDNAGTFSFVVSDGVSDSTTDDLTEGSINLYFTAGRARESVSGGTGITYNSGTGVISIDDSVVVTETDLDAHTDASSGVHGVTGSVVGTTDSQTLSNKTLGSNLVADGNKITGLGTPTASGDAATKGYVDTVAEGLSVKPAVIAATSTNLSGTYDNGTNGVDATLNLGPLATLDIDGVTSWSVGDGVLVKDQTNAFENGRYFIDQVGDAVTDWILNRCPACDEPDEIPSSYVFVQDGTTYNATGWVAEVENPATFAVGTDDITWVQFSGAGTYTAGNGLTLTGSEFTIDTSVTADLNSSQTLTNKTIDGGDNTFQNIPNSSLTNDSVTVNGNEIALGGSATLDTDDISEGSNEYFTVERAQDAAAAMLVNGDHTNISVTYNDATNTLDLAAAAGAGITSTDNLTEGSSNLYFTDERAQDAIDAALSGSHGHLTVTYDDNANTFSITSDATSLNTPSTLVERDGSGNFSAGTITASLSGNATTASALQTSRTISLSGDATGSVSFDGSADADIDVTIIADFATDAEVATAVETGDATATPTYLALDVNSVAKQVAATQSVATAGQAVAHSFAHADYTSAEYLVKVDTGTHTEVSKVLLTLDSSNNIAITEYGIVNTSGTSLSAVSAGINGNDVELLVTTANDNSDVTVTGTLLV